LGTINVITHDENLERNGGKNRQADHEQLKGGNRTGMPIPGNAVGIVWKECKIIDCD